ncbi:MAG: hypothetical protein U5K54_04885 [Cytophagales bacterium]|nr:hypothetical protein [Cytophagales bacterium]
MNRTVFLFLLSVYIFPPKFVIAQKSEVCFICKQNNHDHVPPYNTKFTNEWPYLAASTGLAITGYLFTTLDDIVPYTPDQLDNLNRNDINKFDRGQRITIMEQLVKQATFCY